MSIEQGVSHSLRGNPSLDCLHRAWSAWAGCGQVNPRWRVGSSHHLVFGRSLDHFQCIGLHSGGDTPSNINENKLCAHAVGD